MHRNLGRAILLIALFILGASPFKSAAASENSLTPLLFETRLANPIRDQVFGFTTSSAEASLTMRLGTRLDHIAVYAKLSGDNIYDGDSQLRYPEFGVMINTVSIGNFGHSAVHVQAYLDGFRVDPMLGLAAENCSGAVGYRFEFDRSVPNDDQERFRFDRGGLLVGAAARVPLSQYEVHLEYTGVMSEKRLPSYKAAVFMALSGQVLAGGSFELSEGGDFRRAFELRMYFQ